MDDSVQRLPCNHSIQPYNQARHDYTNPKNKTLEAQIYFNGCSLHMIGHSGLLREDPAGWQGKTPADRLRASAVGPTVSRHAVQSALGQDRLSPGNDPEHSIAGVSQP